MRETLKYMAFGGLQKIGLYRRKRAQHHDKAIVLTYHGIVPEVPPGEEFEHRNFVTTAQFEAQIQFLLKHYRPLKAEDFYLPEGDIRGGFLITFDDGFRNNYRYAMPILKAYGLQGCFFITTNLIGTRDYLWTEQVTLLLERTARPQVVLDLDGQPQTFPLQTAQQKEQASQSIRKRLKMLPSGELSTVMAQLKTQLDDVSLTVGWDEEERYLFMNWEEVRGMIEGGQLIGAHTHNHPMLATLTEAESRSELLLCKEAIERETGRPCLTLSYPNGERENYNQMNIRHLKELGFKCAFTQVPLYNDPQTDRYQLHRVNISLKMSLPIFEAALCGVV